MKKWGKALREKEMQIAIEQRKNPETVEISGFSVLNDRNRYALKLRNIKGRSGFSLFEPCHFTIHSPQNRFFESDQNRYTHLKPLRNQGFQRFYALFFQSVFYRYTKPI